MNYKINNNWHIEAKKQIESILLTLPDLQESDRLSLDLLGDSLSTFHNAIEGLEETGLVITNQQGNLVSSPYVKIKNDAQTTAFKIMKQFGLNPMDNKKLKSGVTEKEASVLDEFLNNEEE